MENKDDNLERFVQKLLKLQEQKEKEEALSDEDLKYIAEGMGINVSDLDEARKSYALRAKGHLNYRNWQDAVKEYKQLIILSPKDAEAYFGLAVAHEGLWIRTQSDEHKNKAIQYAEKVLALNPKHPNAYSLISRLKSKQTNAYVPNTKPQKIKTTGLVIFSVFLIACIATISFFIQNGVVDDASNDSLTPVTENRNSSISIYESTVAMINGKPPVFWSLEYEQYNNDVGLVRDFYVNIINPQTREVINKVYFSKEASITDYPWRRLNLINDDFYFYDSNQKTFEGRNAYTGKVIDNPEILSQKYPELEVGIGELTKKYDWYKLTLKNGDVFWYNPYTKLVHSDKEYQELISKPRNKQKAYYWNYEEEGAKKRYYLFEKEISVRYGSPATRYKGIKIETPEVFKSSPKFFKIRFGEKITEKSEHQFIDSGVLYGDSTFCVIVHKKEVSASVPNMISAIDKNGKLLWEVKEPKSLLLRKIDPKQLYTITTIKSDSRLIIHYPYLKVDDRTYHFACAINLKNGKVLWEYSPDYED